MFIDNPGIFWVARKLKDGFKWTMQVENVSDLVREAEKEADKMTPKGLEWAMPGH